MFLNAISLELKRLFKYLKAAFFVRENIPLLGAVPVNLLAVAFFVVLGFGHPAFWLLGLIGETLFLWIMAGSARFRKLVDALEFQEKSQENQARKANLTAKLIPPNAKRYRRLQEQFQAVKNSYGEFAGDDLMAKENLANLATLESVFLRLLVARQHLTSPNSDSDEVKIRQRIAQLESEINTRESLTRSAVESRRQTLDLLQKRLGVFGKRNQAIDEIESDIEQIEAQFQLAADSAGIRAKPAEAKLDMDLARSMIVSTPEYLILGNDTRPEVVSSPQGNEWEVD